MCSRSIVDFNIWDSQTRFRMKTFVNRSVNIGLAICFFRKASMKIGMPLCPHCCLWGHNTNFCNSTCIFCPICMGPHCKENHRSLSACCKGCPHLDPPSLPLPMACLVPIWLSVKTAAKLMLQTLPTVNSGSIVLIGHGLWPDIHEKVALEVHPVSMHTLLLEKPVLVASLQLRCMAVVVARRR